jgi:hypothetical protein
LLQVLQLGNKNINKRFRNKIIINSSPSGQVSVVVTGTNYSIPDFQTPLINKINSNWTVGPYLVSYNQTSLATILSLSNKTLFKDFKLHFF